MRFFSILSMIVVSVGLISGIGAAAGKLDASLSAHYAAQNVSDLIIKSADGQNFTESEIDAIRKIVGEDADLDRGMSFDVTVEIGGEPLLARMYFLDFSAWEVNLPIWAGGQTAEAIAETGDLSQILCVGGTNGWRELAVGTSFSLDFSDLLAQLAEQGGEPLSEETVQLLSGLERTVTVAGIVQSPIAFAQDGEPSYLQEEGVSVPDTANALSGLNTVDCILYLQTGIIPVYAEIAPMLGEEPVLPVCGDLYVALSDRTQFDAFSREYTAEMRELSGRISSALGEGRAELLTLSDNYSYKSFHAYAEKVRAIAFVLLAAFVFLTSLVVLSNMARLMDEERGQIACLKTLGYSGLQIILRYLLFEGIAIALGGVGAYFVGMGLSSFVYSSFAYSYVLMPMAAAMAPGFFFAAFGVIALSALVCTLILGAKTGKEPPAELLRPKPPRAGRSAIVERIPVLWNRLPFRYKSTVRNVFRYRGRFVTTVVSTACSMGLVIAGLALLDLCLFQDFGSAAILMLSLIVILFAGALTLIVIYTLTGINISERKREIATLMVLGYHDREVTGYLYREIYVTTAIGMVFGYPAGVFLIWLLFSVMNFGALSAVSWFVWLAAPVLVAFFTIFATLILRKKIVGIDMNESLKAIE